MMIVESPGLLTTVQDNGRFGYEQFGVPQSGAMDLQAMQAANVLVGNEPNEGTLEITMQGPTLIFEEPAVFAVVGALFRMALSGTEIETGRAYCASKGDRLCFLSLVSGCRAYLAVAGGFRLPKVLGSLSTSVRHQLGGFEGRKLEKGDRIPLRNSVSELPNIEQRFLPAAFFGVPNRCVRVILGPQEDRFTQAGIDAFLRESYKVGQNSDRMGYRLEGKKIEHIRDGNIISDGIVFGSVQVPTDGQPIIMLADRQTVGGYTKIAAVISTDISRVVQSKAGDSLCFEAVTLEQAQTLIKTWLQRLSWLQQKIDHPRTAPKKFPMLVCEYTVESEEESSCNTELI